MNLVSFWYEMLSKCTDSGYLVGATPPFPSIVLKLCRCFQHGMKMCMWFGYNTLIIFSHSFCFVNLVSFLTRNAIEVKVGKNPGFMSIVQPSGFYWENQGFTRVILGFTGFTG